jgi:hypothetical protein
MRIRAILVTAAAVSAPLAAISFATAAHASTPMTWSATTAVSNRLDSGYGGNNWASDTISRTVAITLTGTATDQCGEVPACYAYTGTIKDTGTAAAITGQMSPGAQGVPIEGTPTANMAGTASVTFYASSNTPDAKLVPAMLSGNGESTSDWVEQFFPTGTAFGPAGPQLTSWSWNYVDLANCQTWTDALSGSKATSGDITGTDECPVLSAGHAVANANGATVTWKSSKLSGFRITLSGPGPENGRTATVTVPKAVFSGLEHGHTYSVKVQDLYDGHPAGKAGVISFVTK